MDTPEKSPKLKVSYCEFRTQSEYSAGLNRNSSLPMCQALNGPQYGIEGARCVNPDGRKCPYACHIRQLLRKRFQSWNFRFQKYPLDETSPN